MKVKIPNLIKKKIFKNFKIKYIFKVAGKIDLDDVLFAICLDSLGKATALSNEINDGGLFVHVSKPPKEGQPAFEFLKVRIQSDLEFQTILSYIFLIFFRF
jgi:hypothetical protein